jgi:hypothetical protein
MRLKEMLGSIGGVLVALAVSVYVLGPMFGGADVTLWVVLTGGVLAAAIPAYLVLSRTDGAGEPDPGADE